MNEITYRMDHVPLLVQVAQQSNEPRLIGANCEQRSSPVRTYHGYSQWAACVEGVFIHLALHLNVIGTDILHIHWLQIFRKSIRDSLILA